MYYDLIISGCEGGAWHVQATSLRWRLSYGISAESIYGLSSLHATSSPGLLHYSAEHEAILQQDDELLF